MAWKVTCPDPIAEALKLTFCWLPGVTVKLAGLAVTPAGSPLVETLMLELKPLMAVAETVRVWLPPIARTKSADDTEIAKSPGGFEPPPLLPHPARNRQKERGRKQTAEESLTSRRDRKDKKSA
jgi:hypothetical protein